MEVLLYQGKVNVPSQGSSAIQIVPALQPKVAQIVNFVRGKTWVSASFVREFLVKLAAGDETVDNCTHISGVTNRCTQL